MEELEMRMIKMAIERVIEVQRGETRKKLANVGDVLLCDIRLVIVDSTLPYLTTL
jgi:ribosomal protein L14